MRENPFVTSSPNIVFAANYTDLCLPYRCLASDVLIELREKTALFSWMQPSHPFSQVDRVIVHLELIDLKTSRWKQFSMDLGRLLQ